MKVLQLNFSICDAINFQVYSVYTLRLCTLWRCHTKAHVGLPRKINLTTHHLNPLLTKIRHFLWNEHSKPIGSLKSFTNNEWYRNESNSCTCSLRHGIEKFMKISGCLLCEWRGVAHSHTDNISFFTKDIHLHTKLLTIVFSHVVEPTLQKLIIYDLNYWNFNYKRMPKMATSGLWWLLCRPSLCQQRSMNRFESLVIRGGEGREGSFDCFLDSWNTTDLMESVLGKMVTTHHPWMLKDLKCKK